MEDQPTLEHADHDHSAQTPWSDPGRYASLLDAVPTDPDGLGEVSRNLIVHYRASGHELPEATAGDINARRIERILGLDQSRHPRPLSEPRQVTERVQGCCRDHSLFAVSVLRAHGLAARTRIGFVDYFVLGWGVDHVVVEFHDGTRWVRFDPELWDRSWGFDRLDIPRGKGFHSAAEVWRGHRAGTLDADKYGVAPDLPHLAGEWFLANYVFFEVAHRFGDEMLLWDHWGPMVGPGEQVPDLELIDELAAALVASDDGDARAEAALEERYRNDPRLHPGETVTRVSPGGEPIEERP